ncbi:hypothetical protein [Spirosoma pomorum]
MADATKYTVPVNGPSGGRFVDLVEFAQLTEEAKAQAADPGPAGPPPVVIIAPEPTPTVLRVLVASRAGHDLVLAQLTPGDPWLIEPVQLPSGNDAFLVRAKNLLANPDIKLLAPVDLAKIAGESSDNYGLDEPASFPGLPGYRFDQFYPDKAKYWEKSDRPNMVDYTAQALAAGVAPAPLPPLRPEPLPSPLNDPELVGRLMESRTASVLSDVPFGYDRLQIIHPPYEDGWQMMMGEIGMRNAPGFPNETPDLLRRHGNNFMDAMFYYGGSRAPWGLPKKDEALFFEVTGACWDPYRAVADVLLTGLETIGNSLVKTLPAWNSVEENGLIDGIPTIKQCHFNIEYHWLLEQPYKGANPANIWQLWTDEQKNRPFFNYHSSQLESAQIIYNRGGIGLLNEALHQKWRNIAALSIQIINRSSNMQAYFGDGPGIAPMHYIKSFGGDYTLSDLLSSNVNDASRFMDANQYANAGKIEVGGQVYNVTGNLKAMGGKSHCYHYEWGVNISAQDRELVLSGQGPRDIRIWHDRMQPELYRPYDKAFHAQLTNYVETKKGWVHPVIWQTESNYENCYFVDGQEIPGNWLGWTENQPPFLPCKVPLHPEVCNSIIYNARMNLQGAYLWGSARRQDLPAGVSEHTNPTVHQTAREGLQRALDEVNQHRAFGPDTINLWDTIKIWNEVKKEWFAGDASQLLLRNGRNAAGQPASPIPLVQGVYRPSEKLELYSVYVPHLKRQDTSMVRFISPINGRELTARATGWGPTLWTRQG